MLDGYSMPLKAPVSPADKNPGLLAARADELRLALQQVNTDILAVNTASAYVKQPDGTGTFLLDFWDRPISVSYPDFRITYAADETELNIAHQALILYYFHTADGTPIADNWISFSDLQDGRFYAQAFQGYSGQQLANYFKDNLTYFKQSGLNLGGIVHNIGDASLIFYILPMVHLLAVAWQGDYDFPSNYQILFNASVNHYLPTDACAIAGSMLTRNMIITGQK